MPAQKKQQPKAKKQNVSKALRPYRPKASGRGAYYLQGGAHVNAKLGSYGLSGGLHGGFSHGNTLIPKYTGLGAYTVDAIRHNVLLKGDPPQIRNIKSMEGAVVVRHREYIQDIISSSTANTFNINNFPLNPGMAATFPWLSTVANNFEEYILNGMLFEFKSVCSEAISSVSLATIGEVMMATQYDAYNPPFTNNQQLLNYEFAQSCKASESALHMIECDPHQSAVSTHLYTRSGAPSGSADLRLYDHGTFSIASNQISGTNVVLGQLWCTYEVILFKPKLSLSASLFGNMFKFYSPTPSSTRPLSGAGPQYDSNNNIGCSIVFNGNNDILSFPNLAEQATYLINIVWTGAAAANNMNVPAVNNCSRIKAYVNNANIFTQSAQSGLAGQTSSTMTLIISTNAGVVPYLTFTNSAIVQTTSVDVIITTLPYMNPAIYGTA